MDVGLIILASTFVLFVIAAVSFVSSLVRHRRQRRFAGALQEVHVTSPGGGGPMDTNLEGLTVEVAADSLSASLLTPLRAGEWMPPADPAPAASLDEASLAGRIATFEPLPSISEPQFAVEQYEPWEVEPTTPGLPVRQAAAPMAGVPLALQVPEVTAPSDPVAADTATDSDLDRELAALMPTAVFEPVAEQAVTVVATVPAPVSVPVQAAAAPVTVPPLPTTSAPAPSVPALPVAPVVAPMPEPVAVPMPEPVAAPTPAPTPAPVAVPAPIPAPVAVPEPIPAPVVVPVPVPVAEPPAPTPALQAAAKEEYWEDMLRGQQPPETPRAQVRAAEARPEVHVSASEPPAVPQSVPVAQSRPARVRPVARVRSAEGLLVEFAPAAAVGEGPDSRRGAVPELVMEAPVEMWFGEARVGVKAGTATYDRFRKYADVLLQDLRATKMRV
ncbi:MAG: hypothetical protein U1E26_04175 [Coriobacteriia bacterium]|nr:hypothetical protein [Coriobacteriia bacterium]